MYWIYSSTEKQQFVDIVEQEFDKLNQEMQRIQAEARKAESSHFWTDLTYGGILGGIITLALSTAIKRAVS